MGEEGGRVTEEDKAWGLSDLEKQGLQVAPGLLGRGGGGWAKCGGLELWGGKRGFTLVLSGLRWAWESLSLEMAL